MNNLNQMEDIVTGVKGDKIHEIYIKVLHFFNKKVDTSKLNNIIEKDRRHKKKEHINL